MAASVTVRTNYGVLPIGPKCAARMGIIKGKQRATRQSIRTRRKSAQDDRQMDWVGVT